MSSHLQGSCHGYYVSSLHETSNTIHLKTAEGRSPEEVTNASVCISGGLMVKGSNRFILNKGARKPNDCSNLIITGRCVAAFGMNSAAPKVTRSGLMGCESRTGTVELLSLFLGLFHLCSHLSRIA